MAKQDTRRTDRELSESHPASGQGVDQAMDALFTWNYEPEIEQLRTLDLEITELVEFPFRPFSVHQSTELVLRPSEAVLLFQFPLEFLR